LSPNQYFDQVLLLFHSLSSYHTDQLSLAGRSIHLCTPSMGLRDRLLPSLEHLVDTGILNQPDLTIWYAEDKDLHQKLKAPPWYGFNAQGYNETICQDDIQLFFQPWQTQLFLYSRSKKIGIYWVQQTNEVPWWECTFSFRILFHFWTRDLPAQLVHAGAMAKDGTGVLITGQSGSGKSTSCLNLLRAGYDYLGDDYVWIELSEQTTVYSLYQTAKIEAENLKERFLDWKPYITNKADYQQQKAIFHIRNLFPSAGIHSSRIKAILLPKVFDQNRTRFIKVSPSNALMAMAPTTLHHLPHNRQISYQKLMKISSSLPSYQWQLGADKEQFTESFHEFLNNELVYH
jgi:hypothetical protein